jgi:hypothetical protein
MSPEIVEAAPYEMLLPPLTVKKYCTTEVAVTDSGSEIAPENTVTALVVEVGLLLPPLRT